MNDKTSATRNSPLDALEGVSITFLTAMSGFDRVALRGETRVLSIADIESTRDRYGDSWLTLIDDEEGQIRRWGEVAFVRTDALDVPPTPWRDRSDPLYAEARELARQQAWKLPDDEARRAALDAVEKDFGPPPSGTTILREGNPEARDRMAWR